MGGQIFYLPPHKYQEGSDALSDFASLAVAREAENGDVQQHSPDSTSSSRHGIKLPQLYAAAALGSYTQSNSRNGGRNGHVDVSDSDSMVSPGQPEDNPSSTAELTGHPLFGLSFDPTCLGRSMMSNHSYTFVGRPDPSFAQFSAGSVWNTAKLALSFLMFAILSE